MRIAAVLEFIEFPDKQALFGYLDQHRQGGKHTNHNSEKIYWHAPGLPKPERLTGYLYRLIDNKACLVSLFGGFPTAKPPHPIKRKRFLLNVSAELHDELHKAGIK